jgi:tRNA(Ile)-lysidine synthase
VSLAVPGLTDLPDSDWTLQTRLLAEWDLRQIAANADPWIAFLDADRVAAPLALRSRRPGDRIRPQGMGGCRVKVSALMINSKIPRAWRDLTPLLVAGDAGEQIVWVCGLRIAEECCVTSETRRVLQIWIEKAAGPASELQSRMQYVCSMNEA